MANEMKRQPKAVVVGGSIAGVSSAHALISAGWQVVVVDKSSGPITGSPTGAGLGLDPLSCSIISSWLGDSSPLSKATLPLTIDQNQVIDIDKKSNRTLTRDEEFNFRAAHWSDLHRLLLGSLPEDGALLFLWGHQFVSSCISGDKSTVIVKARVLQTGEIIQLCGDLLVAADGCFSSVRHSILPNHTLRYAGYCAWRGVLDFSGNEQSETIKGIRSVYPDLGQCLYFDLGPQTHSLIFEVPNKRMNWVWFINQSDLDLDLDLDSDSDSDSHSHSGSKMKKKSVTIKPSKEKLKQMQQDAEKIWGPELASLIKATEQPFINMIYDSDPLQQLFWDNVVLVGDAAHPTTPHCARSTNMSILDAAVLGKCLQKWGLEGLQSALAEYQSTRLPVASDQMLHSRRVGRIKQGLSLPDRKAFHPKSCTSKDWFELQQKSVPFFTSIPDILLRR